MSDQPTSVSTGRPDEDILLDLNFVPQWAKKAPGENHYHAAVERSERPGIHARTIAPGSPGECPDEAAGNSRAIRRHTYISNN